MLAKSMVEEVIVMKSLYVVYLVWMIFAISPVSMCAMNSNNMGGMGQSPMTRGQDWFLHMANSWPAAIIIGGFIIINVGYGWGYQSCKVAYLEGKIKSDDKKIKALEERVVSLEKKLGVG
jgi:hypothetical protein